MMVYSLDDYKNILIKLNSDFEILEKLEDKRLKIKCKA